MCCKGRLARNDNAHSHRRGRTAARMRAKSPSSGCGSSLARMWASPSADAGQRRPSEGLTGCVVRVEHDAVERARAHGLLEAQVVPPVRLRAPCNARRAACDVRSLAHRRRKTIFRACTTVNLSPSAQHGGSALSAQYSLVLLCSAMYYLPRSAVGVMLWRGCAGADVAAASPVLVQMLEGRARSERRCSRGGRGEPSPRAG